MSEAKKKKLWPFSEKKKGGAEPEEVFRGGRKGLSHGALPPNKGATVNGMYLSQTVKDYCSVKARSLLWTIGVGNRGQGDQMRGYGLLSAGKKDVTGKGKSLVKNRWNGRLTYAFKKSDSEKKVSNIYTFERGKGECMGD